MGLSRLQQLDKGLENVLLAQRLSPVLAQKVLEHVAGNRLDQARVERHGLFTAVEFDKAGERDDPAMSEHTLRAQDATDLEAVHIRERDVQKDELRYFPRGDLNRASARMSDKHLVAEVGDNFSEYGYRVIVVIHKQHFHEASGQGCRSWSRLPS
jgi:hypothetical protein